MNMRRKNIWLFLLVDAFVIALSLTGAYLLRFDFLIPKDFLSMILGVLFGTYSSIYIANPILIILNVSQKTILKEDKN